MEKVIRNGKVAVLISGGFGAGFYTWNLDHKELLFHPILVEMVKTGKSKEITPELIEEKLGIANVYTGGVSDLRIVWIEEGTKFEVTEYDGAESLRTLANFDFFIA